MNNWNRSTSYANNVKVYALGLEVKISEKKLEMMENFIDFITEQKMKKVVELISCGKLNMTQVANKLGTTA